jgi:hypothetical protein
MAGKVGSEAIIKVLMAFMDERILYGELKDSKCRSRPSSFTLGAHHIQLWMPNTTLSSSDSYLLTPGIRRDLLKLGFAILPEEDGLYLAHQCDVAIKS